MTQQYIDFGSFPDDPSADSIRESFQKVQDNFTDLYTNSLKDGVLEVVPGFGLRSEDDRITGNLVLYANIPNVTVSTPYTVENGLTNLRVKPRTSPSYSNIAIISDATPIDIDLAPNIKTANANFTGTMKAANLQVYGKVQTSLIPEGDQVLDLGSTTHRWKDLYLSGNTLKIGTQSISSNTSGFVMTGAVVTDSISVGTMEAVTVLGNISTTEQTLVTKLGTLTELSISGDTSSQGNLSLVGNLDSYAVNATTMNVTGSFSAGTITGNIVLPPGATIDAPGGASANMQIVFNDAGKQSAVPGLAYNKTTSLLTIQGNVEGGNIVTSGAMSVTRTATVGNLATGGNVFANSGTVAAGSIVSLGILSATSTITGGNLSTSGFLTVTGNASLGNITTTTVSGVQVTVSGNVSGANLVASGILKVDGQANVGSLTTSGQVSAATLRATADAQIDGNLSSTNGNIVTTNGKLSGASLFSTGLADITGDLIGRSNVTANGLLTVLGNSSLGNVSTSGALSVSGNASIGNISTTGLAVSGNVSGGNLNITGILRAGDSNMANVNATGSMSVTGTHTAGNLATGGALTVTGNANVGNVGTSGFITADGNITGANIKTQNATIFANGTFSGSGISVGTGTISSGNVTISSNVSSGNVFANSGTIQSDLLRGNSITITSNVTSGNMYANSGMIKADVVSGNSANVTGNLESGNIKTTGTANVSSLVVTTGANITGTANIQGTVVGTLFQGNGASLTNLNSTVLSTTITTTAASGTGSVVTLTYVSPGFIPFYAGQSITVSGVTPTGYNGTFTVVTASTTQVTFNHTATGAQTVAGTVTGGSRALSATQADNAAQATVVTASSQPTITSLGTLTGLTLNGSGSISGAASISGGNVNVSSYFLHSLSSSVAATGSTQGSAFVLTKEVNVITSAAAGTSEGVQLPVPPSSTSLQLIIINASSSSIKVYPSSGAQIDSNGSNAPAIVGAGGKLVLFSTSASQWYTLTTIYA